jgi:hypothetical protein
MIKFLPRKLPIFYTISRVRFRVRDFIPRKLPIFLVSGIRSRVRFSSKIVRYSGPEKRSDFLISRIRSRVRIFIRENVRFFDFSGPISVPRFSSEKTSDFLDFSGPISSTIFSFSRIPNRVRFLVFLGSDLGSEI